MFHHDLHFKRAGVANFGCFLKSQISTDNSCHLREKSINSDYFPPPKKKKYR